jgi:hypothetical protein
MHAWETTNDADPQDALDEEEEQEVEAVENAISTRCNIASKLVGV